MEQIQMSKFDEKTEKKIVNALKKILTLEDKPMSEDDAIKSENLFKLDKYCVCMVEAKTPEAKIVLAKFIEKDYDCPYNLPKLEFWESIEIEVVSKYSKTYLKQIINVLSATPTENGSIEIKMKNNFPAQFSNKHWKMVLAPMIEND